MLCGMDAPADTLPARRPPTADEARALGHPTRLRILFACRDQALTNKQLAERLDTTPGTIHYHLRPLVEQGFLRAETPRPGPRGSQEQPYRATGKSWEVAGTADTSATLRAVASQELAAAQESEVVTLSRLGVSLPREALEELAGQVQELIERAHRDSYDDAAAAGTAGADAAVVLFAITRSPGTTDTRSDP